ncbi:lamin tail domain-containing protein [Myxococcaceae bacterium JPH2]|nr:lamin tail domain-containing protein [Myxococcaceae bacterium JPH2]
MMPARVLGALALLVALSACSGDGKDQEGPILPSTDLAATTVGSPFEYVIVARGGTAPLQYTVANPPPGCSFYSGTGKLTGPASQAGDWPFEVTVRDGAGLTSSHTYSLRVWAAPQVTSRDLPDATMGASYTAELNASGGAPPLRWSLTGGSLPGGLTLSPEGIISGVPQDTVGTRVLTVSVTDASGAVATATLNLKLVGPTGGTADGGDGGTTDGGTQTAFPLMIANWNIEWFGDPTPDHGPSNEPLQLANAVTVISSLNPDIMGVAEIVDTAQFNSLIAQLPGYDGFLADDSTRVPGGSNSYTADEQKVGVLFKKSVAQVLSARVVLTGSDYQFAGRPPLRVDFRVTRNGTPVDLSLLVLHMKAMATQDDYDRRKDAAGALKGYLDTELPDANALVVGDWNDDVDVSTTKDTATGQYLPSPFGAFLNDSTHYTFLTQALSATQGSTVSFSSFIDHQLASNELAAHYEAKSATVAHPAITSYKSSTSDHYPVFTRFDFSTTSTARQLRLTAPNGGETLAADATFPITWTSSGVSNVRLRYTLDNGATWKDIVTSVPATPATYTWTVPREATTSARVQVMDVDQTTVLDQSDAAFTMTRPPPTVFINEYLPQPFNVAGTSTPDYDQQFVELVNSTNASVDISGWRIDDLKSHRGLEPTRHVFAQGTVIPAHQVYVVYSGASAVPANATNATSSNGGMGLRFDRGVNQGSAGDSLYLKHSDGTVEDSTSYVDAYTGTSYNRSPDASNTGSWVLHTSLSSSQSSPGKHSNGTAF